MNKVEAHAADALTDSRLLVNIPAPWIFRVLGKKTIKYPVPFPTGQTLARMARLFTRLDLDLKELRAGDMGTTLACIGNSTVAVSRIIAYGMLRGTLASRLLNRPLAWYLRCYMDMKTMAELTQILVLLSSPEAFMNIITSVSTLNMMAPTMSQTKEKGS
ncbi:hypothetical protein DW083_20290 [Parabacteroides sp. AF48-14]|uniref:hypothetical protein n=1 Tax=Parabacteroides sp. AF48-14 TaxID=2292052 RepID=UPI000F00290C|nr:hypothetical protein [Parabacteroides sp. AF48-14]RHO65714.1 hypothetical protein DW083_20290 [Parabacteroides sp. AF48-14]